MDLSDLIRAFLTLLLISLVTLKLTGLADISWWWVFSPIWLPLIPMAILAFVGIWLALAKKAFNWLFMGRRD